MSEESWVGNYAASMAARNAAWEASRHSAQERSRAQSAASKANRASGQAERRCIVPGCKFVWHKGRLCRRHWREVPANDRFGIVFEAMAAQRRVADRAHRRVERELLARLNSSKDSP